MPNLQRKKIKMIAGIDEAGRGPLAGPVFAVAITVPPNFKLQIARPPCFATRSGQANFKLRDSKKTSPKRREEIYEILKKDPLVKWGIGRTSERVIDKINIFQATKLSMKKAVLNLEKKINVKAGLLLIDGNFGIGIKRPQKSIIKGDEKIFLISLASIVAKVERDRSMLKMHKKYPQYGFDKHKGYGTKLHFERLKKFGSCKIHRQSFEPIKSTFGKF